MIGAGIVGCPIARAMARACWTVTVLDGGPAAGCGSTSRSSSIVGVFRSHETACAVAHEARARGLAREAFLGVRDPRARYTEAGGLVLLREAAPDAFAASLAGLRALAVPFERVDAATVARLCPGIDLTGYGARRRCEDPRLGEPSGGRVVGGIHLPTAGWMDDPQLAFHNPMTSARAAGAVFLLRAPVTAVPRKARGVTGVVLRGGERIPCRRIVNAAGPHSAKVDAPAGAEPPIGTRAGPAAPGTPGRAPPHVDRAISMAFYWRSARCRGRVPGSPEPRGEAVQGPSDNTVRARVRRSVNRAASSR